MIETRARTLARELGDAEIAGLLVRARAEVVHPVPHHVARGHLRAMTVAAAAVATTAASASGAAAAVGAGTASTTGSVIGGISSVKLAIAAATAAAVTAGGLAATGNLPGFGTRSAPPAEPTQIAPADRPESQDPTGDVDADLGDTTEEMTPADEPPVTTPRSDEVARDDEAPRGPDAPAPGPRDEGDVGVGGGSTEGSPSRPSAPTDDAASDAAAPGRSDEAPGRREPRSSAAAEDGTHSRAAKAPRAPDEPPAPEPPKDAARKPR